MEKDRFVRIDGADEGVDWVSVKRARSMMGLKSYVTNIAPAVMDDSDVAQAYQDFYQVDRVVPDDLDRACRPTHLLWCPRQHRGPPQYHFRSPSHLRESRKRPGLSIKKISTALRPKRSATITIGGQQLTAPTKSTLYSTGCGSTCDRK